jgi:hypothetical protein
MDLFHLPELLMLIHNVILHRLYDLRGHTPDKMRIVGKPKHSM